MGLEKLNLQADEVSMPTAIRQLIESAWDEIHRFTDQHRRDPVKGFHPSDFEDAYNWLALIRRQFPEDQVPRLCEWGSGIGAISVLAERLGFKAVAIESDHELFESGLKWLESVGSKIESIRGSFVPVAFAEQLKREMKKGLLDVANTESDSMWLDLEAKSVFEEGELQPDDFEVIYAYPWPNEEAFLFRLFELVAKPSTLLLTFHGAADFRLHRKGQA